MKSKSLFYLLTPALAVALSLGALGGALSGTSNLVCAAESEADFDRLDGMGKSTKRVDVIEWEGNLEIHVYPKGSVKGLALKIDDKDKNKKVMIIGYRFDTWAKQLIRRNILSIPLRPGFKTYKDSSAEEYDNFIVSNNGMSGQVALFQLDPEPSQLYPDGHPALNKVADAPKPAETGSRVPAASGKDTHIDLDGDNKIKHFEF